MTTEKPCKNCGRKRETRQVLTQEQSDKIISAILAMDNSRSILPSYTLSDQTLIPLREKDEYWISIGLMWFYDQWVIEKESFNPDSAYRTVKRWQEKNNDMWTRILKWWIINSNNSRIIISCYISSILLNESMS